MLSREVIFKVAIVMSGRQSEMPKPTFAIFRAKSNLPEKCILTNICDKAMNNEMKVVGEWEFELVKARTGKYC